MLLSIFEKILRQTEVLSLCLDYQNGIVYKPSDNPLYSYRNFRDDIKHKIHDAAYSHSFNREKRREKQRKKFREKFFPCLKII